MPQRPWQSFARQFCFQPDVRRRLPPQIPLLKPNVEAQSRWRQQISLDTMEKGSGKASIASRRSARSIIRTSKRWPEVGLTNNEARYNFSCSPCRPHARLLENDFIRTRSHHAVKSFRQARCPLAPQPRWLRYRWLVRLVGVARGFAFAVFLTGIVPSRAIAGVGDASGYFLVEGQIKRHG